MRPKAINVKILDRYVLVIEFDNGEIKEFDVKPYLDLRAFKKIKEDYNEFKKVKIDGLSIAWECGIDICPDELYNNGK